MSSLRGKRFRLLLLLIVLNLITLPNTDAQTYSQPMLGISWNTHEISVSIPATPRWARNALKTAMANWEMAQLWFIQTYFSGQSNARFSFVPANGSQPELKIEYVNDAGQYWTGDTEVPVSGPITNETILLVLSRLAVSGDVIQVTQHELGHVFGLDHTAYSQDLMYPAMDAYSGGEPVNPSTVNLYGVYLLGEGCNFFPGQMAVLPSWIPYLEWSANSQETSANMPQGTPTNPCPSQRRLWTQPWFGFSLAAAVAIAIATIINARRKKLHRPTKSVEY